MLLHHKVGLEDDARPTIRCETGLSTVTGNIGASKENSYFANEQEAGSTLRESTGELSTTGGIGTLTQAATKNVFTVMKLDIPKKEVTEVIRQRQDICLKTAKELHKYKTKLDLL